LLRLRQLLSPPGQLSALAAATGADMALMATWLAAGEQRCGVADR
jgi:hypothetical protein